MDSLLEQLGTLLLGSVPTIVLFTLLVAAYTLLVHRPLTRTLEERHARTAGAVEKAHQAIAAADAKSREYEDRLRAARADIYKGREARLRQWAAERDRALEEARMAAQEKIRIGKDSLDAQAKKARQEMEPAIEALAAQVAQAVVPRAGSAL
jgi:F-type H+-transporting ATPase subunit b